MNKLLLPDWMITVLDVASCFYHQSLKVWKSQPLGGSRQVKEQTEDKYGSKADDTHAHTNTHKKNSPMVIASSGEERREGWRIVSVILTLKFVCVDPTSSEPESEPESDLASAPV